jgi:hypothetical protein
MAGPLNASVILARCAKTKKLYGMRAEQRGNDWVRTWAFPIDEQKAKREGFTDNKISGSLQEVDDYPGCPYCGAMESFIDNSPHCGKMSCWSGETKKHTCPWCGQTYGVQRIDKVDVSGGGY